MADATDQLLAERDENTCRKDFTPSELLALGRRLEELERPKAKERQREGRVRGGEVFAGREALDSTGPQALSKARTNEVVGQALGISRGTYARLKLVDATTHDEDPELAELAREQM